MLIEEAYNPAFLSGLIDQRREEPDIEYKAWLNLTVIEVKAKIAKHLCALSNFGGGWLIFGITDDGAHAEPHPGDLQGYRQDVINTVVDKYLTPSFHCQVYFGTSSVTGKKYPIVRVPPHGATPICAKANGPVSGKSIVGVNRGIHYIRVPGPKSVPIDAPQLWRDLIHRCVVNERQTLLGSIGRLFDRPATIMEVNALDSLIEAGISRWNEVVPATGWSVDPKANRVVFAFRLLTAEREPPPSKKLRDLKAALREASNAADVAIRQGWSFFMEAGNDDQRPKVELWDEVEGYEADMVATDSTFESIPALWRAMTNGSGFEIRLQAEDRSG